MPSGPRKPPDPDATVTAPHPDPGVPVDPNATVLGPPPAERSLDQTFPNVPQLPSRRSSAPKPIPVDQDRTQLNVNPDLVGAIPAAPESRPSRSGSAPKRVTNSGVVPVTPKRVTNSGVVPVTPKRVTNPGTVPVAPKRAPRGRRLRVFVIDSFVAVCISGAVFGLAFEALKLETARRAANAPTPVPSATPLPPEASAEDQARSRDMMSKGDQAVVAQKLANARWDYAQAMRLDPRCESCASRLGHVEEEMYDEARSLLAAAIKDIDAAQYDEAQRELAKVQELAKDPQSDFYREAARDLEIVQKRRSGSL